VKIDVKKLKNLVSDMSVLYAEDETDLREKVVLYLKKLFHTVKDASNGEEALEIFKSEDFDIVITDIRMPKMDGVELAKQIKSINPKQQAILKGLPHIV
jgi:two-component system cell cycle response regulator